MKHNTPLSQGKDKRVVNNILISFGTKIVLMLLSIVIPRLFILSYGSEVNGLLSTITQIFSYLALLEAGIGNASINALYKPLDNKNHEQVNQVIGESRAYFRRVTLFYALGVIGFSVAYPLLADSKVDAVTIAGIILLQGIGNCVTYYFSAAHTQLLIADGKNYFVDVITFCINVGTSLSKIILVSAGFDILIVHLVFLVVTLFKAPLILGLCYKQYPWLKPIKTKRFNSIQERGAFIVHEISTTIFSSTDVFLISTFCSFSLASVYSVYQMIFGALNTMVNTANAGLGFLLGQNYYKDHQKFLSLYDRYSTLYSGIVFVVMTVAHLMITPFISLYTAGVADVNYQMAGLSLLFVLINLMSGVRAVAARLIAVTGHADKTKYRSIFETVINLTASVILVNWIGIYGVLVGTIIALLYRTNDIIIYANKVILERSPWHEYKGLLINSAVFAIIAIIAPQFIIPAGSYLELIVSGFFVTVVVLVIYGSVMILMNRDFLKHKRIEKG